MSKTVYVCEFCGTRYPVLADAEECEHQHQKLVEGHTVKIMAVVNNEETRGRDRIFVQNNEGFILAYDYNINIDPFKLDANKPRILTINEFEARVNKENNNG